MQLYFCYRLWIISERRWWPVATVVVVLSVSSAAIFYGVRRRILLNRYRTHRLELVCIRWQGFTHSGPIPESKMPVSVHVDQGRTRKANGTALVPGPVYVHVATGLTADIILSTMTGFFLLRSRNGAE